MASVTAFEAKTRFGQLLERVTRGEEIVITRHDKPVARIAKSPPENIAARFMAFPSDSKTLSMSLESAPPPPARCSKIAFPPKTPRSSAACAAPEQSF